MVDVTWPSIFSAADATIDQLNGLNLAERSRSLDGIRFLEAAVARLDGAWVDQPDEAPAPRQRNERDVRSAPAPDPVPFVALPQRVTHGGDWGPKLREKLTAIALGKMEKRGW